MTDNGKEIGVAILKVMEEVGYVQKEKKGGLQYSYTSEAALIAALRPAMIKHGIFCYVTDLPQIEREEFTTTKGTNMNRATAHGIVRFMHPESGSSIDVHAMGEGMDAGDKAGNKAATGLLKYALRQTFLIETGDDPDSTSSDEQEKIPEPTSDERAVLHNITKPPKKKDPTTAYYTLIKKAEFSKEQSDEILESVGGDFAKAYDILAEQHFPPEEHSE